MYISETNRAIIKQKFGGRCAYSGTILKADWQVDHVEPLIRDWWVNNCRHVERHKLDNMFPCQKIINHYKGSLDLETFREWYLGGLHERLKKLPKNTKSKETLRRKKYLLKVAKLFGITPEKPFSGEFYFEKVARESNDPTKVFKVLYLPELKEMYCFGRHEHLYVVGLQENSTIKVERGKLKFL